MKATDLQKIIFIKDLSKKEDLVKNDLPVSTRFGQSITRDSALIIPKHRNTVKLGYIDNGSNEFMNYVYRKKIWSFSWSPKWSLLNINVHGYNKQLWMVPWYLLQPSLSVIETSKKIDLPRSLFQSYKLLNNLKFPSSNHQMIGKTNDKTIN